MSDYASLVKGVQLLSYGPEEDFLGGRARKAMDKIADVLEVDSISPTWSIVIPLAKKILCTWEKFPEYRFLMLSKDSLEYIPIADLEDLRVRAKKIEMMKKGEEEE